MGDIIVHQGFILSRIEGSRRPELHTPHRIVVQEIAIEKVEAIVGVGGATARGSSHNVLHSGVGQHTVAIRSAAQRVAVGESGVGGIGAEVGADQVASRPAHG